MCEPFSPNLTFTEGFVLGQASFLIILLLFIRYVVFSPSEQIDHEGWRKRRAERADVRMASSKTVHVLTSGFTKAPL